MISSMEKSISLNIFAIQVIGICPPGKISPCHFRVIIFSRFLTVSSILFILLPAAAAARINLLEKEIFSSVEIIALILSSAIVFYKTVNLILQRDRVKNLLYEMSKLWREAKDEEIEAIRGFAKIGKRVTQFYFILGILNVATFVGQPFFTFYLAPTTAKNITSITSFNRLPFNGWENFSDSIETSIVLFVALFVLHVVAGAIATIASIGHDCLFAVLILQVCGNLRSIAVKLGGLEFSKDHTIVLQESEILRCGKKLQRLIDYTAELEKIVSQFLLIQTLHSTVTICLTGFMMSRNIQINKELVKYFFYWAASLFQLFIFCWTGNYLQTETNFVGRSAYDAYGNLMNLSLQEISQRDRKTVEKISQYLKIILLRSQTPINITAGKFYKISLENYKNMLSTSYSYFTILRAFADNKT